jgi:light-regulated signal transduction histidine kinase (bacteriophytochrome)
MRKKLDDFAYLASHDLLEPLRKISTLSEFLKIRYKDALGKDGGQYLDMIATSVENMRGIINSLLEFTNINTKTPHFENTDLNQVLENVKMDQELRIIETNATITFNSLPIVEAVPAELRIMYNNLIGNALKFTRDKRPVITIESAELTSDEKKKYNLLNNRKYYKISTTDNGIGFEQEYAELIFGVFQRLNGKSDYQGFGIGLAVCKKIAERHSSLIFAHSELGKGSTFSLVIPEKQSD